MSTDVNTSTKRTAVVGDADEQPYHKRLRFDPSQTTHATSSTQNETNITIHNQNQSTSSSSSNDYVYNDANRTRILEIEAELMKLVLWIDMISNSHQLFFDQRARFANNGR